MQNPLLFNFKYALRSAVEMAGLSPDEALVELQPRDGELTLRTEDILDAIEKEGECLSVALFSGVHYYTGQKFDIKTITKAAQDKGAYAGKIRDSSVLCHLSQKL
jgi:kynureninase